jgi:REP element-mobilizing transposase RayT
MEEIRVFQRSTFGCVSANRLSMIHLTPAFLYFDYYKSVSFISFKPTHLILMIKSYHPEFLTATILNWQHLLDDEFKQIVINAMRWLVNQKRCRIYGFVIMPNHIHLLWKIADGFDRANVRGALLSFTAHEFKMRLATNPIRLKVYQVNLVDRTYQFWQRDCAVKECWSEMFFEQKLDYILNNPLQPHWNLADLPERYFWSSASFYIDGKNSFDFITHYKE